MAKIKKVGKGATIITLLSNPMVRRVVIKGATRAANSASHYIAARTDKKSPPPPKGPGPVPAPTPPSGTTVASKTPSKPPSFAESAAVESIVGSVASAAKPVAERLASSPAGRSVLQAVNSITGQVLGGTDAAKRTGGSVASFVGNIIANQGTSKPQTASGQPKVKFTPVKPPATAPPPVETMQWPPPKSNGSGNS